VPDSFATRLYGLLNKPTAGKYHYLETGEAGARTYEYGKMRRICFADFRGHLEAIGDCIAVAVVEGGRANFLCLDLDNHFRDRLAVAKAVLERRGLELSAFATSGSSPDRGKVIICLACPMPQEQARELIKDIFLEAVDTPTFQGSEEVDLFPVKGQGGAVRSSVSIGLALRMPDAWERRPSILTAAIASSSMSYPRTWARTNLQPREPRWAENSRKATIMYSFMRMMENMMVALRSFSPLPHRCRQRRTTCEAEASFETSCS
jgi:hypothetical protein